MQQHMDNERAHPYYNKMVLLIVRSSVVKNEYVEVKAPDAKLNPHVC